MANEIPQGVYDFLYQHRDKKPEIQENDFTPEIAAEVWGVSEEYARRLLNTMFANGKVDKIKMGRKFLYRPIDTENDLTNPVKPV